jgi:chaperone BCS1
MVAAMANFLGYDVYDLELTTVKDSSDLRKLLIETTGKSIIVIEDIDCLLDLTGQRKKKEKDENDAETGKEKDPISKKKREAEEESKRTSKVTLSGLEFHRWNLVSMWGRKNYCVHYQLCGQTGSCFNKEGEDGQEHKMSYCRFEAFKVLAKNYLELESHELFGKIEELLGKTDISC